jgi:hypothetical protein
LVVVAVESLKLRRISLPRERTFCKGRIAFVLLLPTRSARSVAKDCRVSFPQLAVLLLLQCLVVAAFSFVRLCNCLQNCVRTVQRVKHNFVKNFLYKQRAHPHDGDLQERGRGRLARRLG